MLSSPCEWIMIEVRYPKECAIGRSGWLAREKVAHHPKAYANERYWVASVCSSGTLSEDVRRRRMWVASMGESWRRHVIRRRCCATDYHNLRTVSYGYTQPYTSPVAQLAYTLCRQLHSYAPYIPHHLLCNPITISCQTFYSTSTSTIRVLSSI
jgi:hypothetical protein